MSQPFPTIEQFVDPSQDFLQPPATGGHVFVLRQVFNPIRVARTLIQLGYEPLAPYPSSDPLYLLGWPKRVFYYPNIFVYARHLFREGGVWYVMTCGFAARLIFDVLTEACQFMNRRFILEHYPEETRSLQVNVDDADIDDDVDAGLRKTALQEALLDNIMEEASLPSFTMHLCELISLKIYEVILTQPFYVIMVRQMASFVGKETEYSWFHQAIYSTYKESGLLGFFQGITPRLICEFSRLIIYFLVCRCIRRLALNLCPRTNHILGPMRSLMFIVIGNLSYSYEVVTCMMAVRGSNLIAASDANQFRGWRDCKQGLTLSGQINRGVLPFWRRHVQVKHISN